MSKGQDRGEAALHFNLLLPVMPGRRQGSATMIAMRHNGACRCWTEEEPDIGAKLICREQGMRSFTTYNAELMLTNEICAPQSGFVQELAVHTVGGVIAPGAGRRNIHRPLPRDTREGYGGDTHPGA
ncbi:hypothetical protein G5V57_13705 [Nordella sp. HKS 07]|uniref:hypothetical protein n=1 Tax=Nordella sp. HKS 07 TaxID=2712222 RepID=UPI0013E12DB5|nr:hypothetical protein [Nordella sp. HKS 07]QIG46274.1 hypothetical protein G5V57_13705 [Nordella sp. HKS 07]